MSLIGPGELIVAVFLVLGLLGASARVLADRRSATLVVQKFQFSVVPLPIEPASVEVVGRMQGLLAFALSSMGFSPITRFMVSGSELRWQTTSLWGQESQFVPLRSVSSLAAGVTKPISALVAAAAITVTGILLSVGTGSWAPIAIALLIAIVCAVYYLLSKRFFIAVHPHGGPSIRLVFKPNVIEGIPINVQQAFAVIGVIRDMILSKGGMVALAPPLAAEEGASPLGEAQSAFWTGEKQPPSAGGYEDAEDKANALYAHAKQLAQSGDHQQAIEVLKDIMRQFPTTKAGQKARRNLGRVGA